jgi:hypothetical protein
VKALLEPLGGPNGLLAATGLRIRAGATRTDLTDDSAALGAEGLTIEVNGRIDVSALQQLLNALPPLPTIPGSPVQLTDAVAILGSDQVRSLSIGQVTVDLTARSAPALDASTDAGTGSGGIDLGAGGTGALDLPDLGAAPAGAGGGTGGTVAPSSDPLPLPPLPASGALAAIGGGLLLSVGLRRLADGALAPGGAAGACDLTTDPEGDPHG